MDNTLVPAAPGVTFYDTVEAGSLADVFWTNLFLLDAAGNVIDQTHGTNLLRDAPIP